MGKGCFGVSFADPPVPGARDRNSKHIPALHEVLRRRSGRRLAPGPRRTHCLWGFEVASTPNLGPHRGVHRANQQELLASIRQLAQDHTRTSEVEHFLVRKKLPVDIRHNSKIFREQLAVWAADKIS